MDEEQQEEGLQERIDGFDAELRALLEKYELGIGAQAEVMADGRIGARSVIFSTRKKVEEKKDQVIAP